MLLYHFSPLKLPRLVQLFWYQDDLAGVFHVLRIFRHTMICLPHRPRDCELLLSCQEQLYMLNQQNHYPAIPGRQLSICLGSISFKVKHTLKSCPFFSSVLTVWKYCLPPDLLCGGSVHTHLLNKNHISTCAESKVSRVKHTQQTSAKQPPV